MEGTDAFGHRHDWEHVVVWVEEASNDVQFVAISAHGDMDVKPRAEVPFLNDTQPKVVYHKDGASTHAFRFAKTAEIPENLTGDWHLPALVDFNGFPSTDVRDKLYNASWGKANFDLKDGEFAVLLEKAKPAEIPFDPNAAG